MDSGDGLGLLIYFGVWVLILFAPIQGSITAKILMCIFWPLMLPIVVLGWLIQLVTGSF